MLWCSYCRFIMEINQLPIEMLLEIFLYLPFRSITNAEKVCMKWREVINTNSIRKWIPAIYVEGSDDYGQFSKEIMLHCREIRYLKFANVSLYSTIHAILPLCTELTHLTMIMCFIQCEYTEDLKKCTKLKNLRIQNSYCKFDTTNVSLNINFELLPDLEDLTLTDFGLQNINMNGLTMRDKLVHLRISKIKHLSKECMKQLIESHKDTLKTVEIYGCSSIDDSFVECLSKAPNISTVTIIHCVRLTNTSLRYLSNVKKWNGLSLWNNETFAEKSLMSLFNCNNLKNIKRISFSKIANVSISTVRVIAHNCPHLDFFGVYRCPLIQKHKYDSEFMELFPKINYFIF